MPGEMIAREEQEDFVGGADSAVLIDEPDAVTVPIESDAQIGFRFDDFRLEFLERRILARIRRMIRELPVGFHVEAGDVGADASQNLAIRRPGDAVPGVDDDTQSFGRVVE
jgi:hypothetical protein